MWSGSDETSSKKLQRGWIPMWWWNVYWSETSLWSWISLSWRHRRVPLWLVFTESLLHCAFIRNLFYKKYRYFVDLGHREWRGCFAHLYARTVEWRTIINYWWTDEIPDPPTDCESTEFRCADNDCIDVSLRCNGVYDCADGSDEADCGIILLLLLLLLQLLLLSVQWYQYCKDNNKNKQSR